MGRSEEWQVDGNHRRKELGPSATLALSETQYKMTASVANFLRIVHPIYSDSINQTTTPSRCLFPRPTARRSMSQYFFAGYIARAMRDNLLRYSTSLALIASVCCKDVANILIQVPLPRLVFPAPREPWLWHICIILQLFAEERLTHGHQRVCLLPRRTSTFPSTEKSTSATFTWLSVFPVPMSHYFGQY